MDFDFDFNIDLFEMDELYQLFIIALNKITKKLVYKSQEKNLIILKENTL